MKTFPPLQFFCLTEFTIQLIIKLMITNLINAFWNVIFIQYIFHPLKQRFDLQSDYLAHYPHMSASMNSIHRLNERVSMVSMRSQPNQKRWRNNTTRWQRNTTHWQRSTTDCQRNTTHSNHESMRWRRNAMHWQRVGNALQRIFNGKRVCVVFPYAGFSQIGSHIHFDLLECTFYLNFNNVQNIGPNFAFSIHSDRK